MVWTWPVAETRGENAVLDLVALQDLLTPEGSGVAAAPFGAKTEVVVVRTIDRDADQKVIVVKESALGVVELGGVGLEDVSVGSRLLVLVLKGDGCSGVSDTLVLRRLKAG